MWGHRSGQEAATPAEFYRVQTHLPITTGEEVSSHAGEKPALYKRVRLVVCNIPASRIADVNRGIFLPLSAAMKELKFTIEIDITSGEGISPATLENKIKETIWQIGARVDEGVVESLAVSSCVVLVKLDWDDGWLLVVER